MERRLESGYINAIPAGSSFYIVNTGRSERLHMICSIDSLERMEYGTYPQVCVMELSFLLDFTT